MQGPFEVWPDRVDERAVAGALVIVPGQHDEERRGIHAAVVLSERNFLQGGHLAWSRFMDDLSGLGVLFWNDGFRLCRGEESEDAPPDVGRDPQHFERGDDPVPAEWRAVPGDAGIGV